MAYQITYNNGHLMAYQIYYNGHLITYQIIYNNGHLKAILLEEQLWHYLIHTWGDKWVHTFFEGVSSKVNIIALRGFKVALYNIAVKLVSHYIIESPPFAFN